MKQMTPIAGCMARSLFSTFSRQRGNFLNMYCWCRKTLSPYRGRSQCD